MDIKITGFKYAEIKVEVANILNDSRSYNFPEYWDCIVEMLASNNLGKVKNLTQGMNEWKRLEANFKLTMPQS